MNKSQLKPDRKHLEEKITEILGDGILDCEEVDITARKVVDYVWPLVQYQESSRPLLTGHFPDALSEAERTSMADLISIVESGKYRRPRIDYEGREFNLVEFLMEQKRWSEETFGPARYMDLMGVLEHMKKEIAEIEESPNDSHEWADLILLAFDGAWRSGLHPLEIVLSLIIKFEINKGRTWPDWRKVEPGKAIEHVSPAMRDALMSHKSDIRYDVIQQIRDWVNTLPESAGDAALVPENTFVNLADLNEYLDGFVRAMRGTMVKGQNSQ